MPRREDEGVREVKKYPIVHTVQEQCTERPPAALGPYKSDKIAAGAEQTSLLTITLAIEY
jgi:hypothetical protein